MNKSVRTKSLSVAIIALALVTAFTVNLFGTSASAAINENEKAAMDVIDTLTATVGGSSAKTVDASEYEALLELKLMAFENENYIYLFNQNDHNMKAIILKKLPNIPQFGEITSEIAAKKAAESFVKMVSPDFFALDSYDVICRKSGDEGYVNYSVELWEKISDDFYTGNKIGIIFTEKGYLSSFIARDSESDQAIESLTNGISADSVEITESKAVILAFSEIKNVVSQLERGEQSLSEESIVKTGDDIIISDFGENMMASYSTDTAEAYDIKLDETKSQTVDTYRELNNGRVQWVITVTGVKTNREWDMAFTVVLDAQTGEIVVSTHTR